MQQEHRSVLNVLAAVVVSSRANQYPASKICSSEAYVDGGLNHFAPLPTGEVQELWRLWARGHEQVVPGEVLEPSLCSPAVGLQGEGESGTQEPPGPADSGAL